MLPLLRLVALALVVLVPFGVSACGGDDDGEAGGETTATEEGGEEAAPSFELKIGSILPLTGDLASFGPAQAQAARIAVERIEEDRCPRCSVSWPSRSSCSCPLE